MPKISVIIPIYNVESYLRSSIESVLRQTFTDFEVILVDDGSPDQCPAICDEYAAADDRIRVIHKQNGGLSSARNAGIEIACGDYMFMLDSDDTIAPETLSKAWKSATEYDSDLVIVGVRVHNIQNGTEINHTDMTRPQWVLHGSAIMDTLADLIEESMFNYAWDKLYRRETVTKNKLRYNSFFDRVCEDTVFLYDLLPYLQCVSTVPDICYNYMIRDNQSVVRKYLPERFEKYMAKWEKLRAIAQKHRKNDAHIFEILDKQYVNSVLWSISNIYHKDCYMKPRDIYRFMIWMQEQDTTDEDYRTSAIQTKSDDISRGDKLVLKFYAKKYTRLLTLAALFMRFKYDRNRIKAGRNKSNE